MQFVTNDETHSKTALFSGNPSKKNPKIIGQTDYGKRRQNDLLKWDPRPPQFRNAASVQKQNDFVQSVQMFEAYGEKAPNYAYSVKFVYEEYSVPRERKLVLREKVKEYHENLKKNLIVYDNDSLSNESAIHIASTIEQSKSGAWKR